MLELDRIYAVDAREGLRQLDAESVDCVVTSPPYWATRDYGVPPVRWADGSEVPLGLESDPEDFVEHLCEVFDEVARVLKEAGTLWVNLGDMYWIPERVSAIRTPAEGSPRLGSSDPCAVRDTGFAKKSLCLIPERFALAMAKRGWVLRNKIVWHKPNHMPSSARDRLACAWEYVFLFTKSIRYFFDLDAVRVPHRPSSHERRARAPPRATGVPVRGLVRPPGAYRLHPLGRNPGDCWSISTGGGRGGHPAVYPERLCERPILAGCPAGGVVLDPFVGSGTTAVVAQRLGRRFIGLEVSPGFAELARQQLASQNGRPRGQAGGTPC